MHAKNRRCAFLHLSDPKQRYKLFDSLVLPILSYASEVWAVDRTVSKSAEQLHWQFLKRVLGVRGSTATLIVLAEFGRYISFTISLVAAKSLIPQRHQQFA